MSEANGPDPLDRLRAADPMRADDVPSASLARVSARVQEHIMTDTPKPASAATLRRPLALIGAVGLVGVVALAVALSGGLGPKSPSPVAVVPSSTPAPTVVPSEEPSGEPSIGPNTGGGGLASCIRYDPSLLPSMDVVFDGTVTKVEGDQVTFDVNTSFKGASGSITLTDPTTGTSVALLGPLPDFKVGGRYLVTGAGSNINSCGYTLEYDADTAASWAAAFGG
jgi:hypothetical protein